MGNCSGKQHKPPAGIIPSELLKKTPSVQEKPKVELIPLPLPTPPECINKGSPVVKLYGPANSTATFYIRFGILYKPVSLQYTPSNIVESPVLYCDSDVVSGSPEEIFRYLDSKFPEPPLLVKGGGSVNSFGWFDKTTPLVVWMVNLQHRSMMWHLERMVRWAEDMAHRGGKTKGDPVMGSPKMEMKKFGRNYEALMEIMLEHARMEERVVFPILDKADRGLSKAANEEHGRDLPVMNGIKEDIKSIGVLDLGTPVYQEALLILSNRLKKLKENSKQHFEEEEKELLPYMEATDLGKVQQGKVLEQCLDSMRETHGHNFRFFLEGLLPQDAIHYLDMIIKSSDNNRVSLMLHMVVD
ncbi:OLC1v1026391C1 [Oldenlandia corymbosa var. corymbosa]|uniref:OLC1v1026391C1 n=1 Tax=Oldenlandia corymbosa var. corymbosa TaxID=529605 RepID=A0AAV1C7Q5_OLDCO|nr:OLC1v1026391C1 [Oldenlandia corymbosa var. corymbosa]